MNRAKISRLDSRHGQTPIQVVKTMKGHSHVLHESVSTTNVTKLGESDLGNNSTKLSGGGGDTMGSGTVASGEDLSRDDEGGRVGAEVLEEVGQAVEEDESLGSTTGGNELVVGETHDNEGASKNDETHQLDRLAPPGVDEKEGDPVSGDETSDGENQVTDRDVVQVVEDLLGSSGVWRSEADGGQNDGRVETETVESDLNGG